MRKIITALILTVVFAVIGLMLENMLGITYANLTAQILHKLFYVAVSIGIYDIVSR
jgi:uncharacterized membrane protein